MAHKARRNPSYLTLCLEDDEWEELEKRANEAKLSITEWARLLLLAAGGKVSLIKDLISSHRLVLTTIDEFGQLKEIGENWRNRYNEAQSAADTLHKEIRELKKREQKPKKATPAKQSAKSKKKKITKKGKAPKRKKTRR